MAFPKLLQKLFQGNGANSVFNKSLMPAIDVADVPAVFVKTESQSFSDAQKQQARSNIGAIAYADLPSSVPTGCLSAFAGTTIPDGWLLCNGAKVSRTTYSALFAVIGTSWGTGDGSTTFTLPDLSGRFLEGTIDTSKVGTYLSAGLPNITGTLESICTTKRRVASGAISFSGTAYYNDTVGATVSNGGFTFDASKSSSIFARALTVQPESAYALIIIKA